LDIASVSDGTQLSLRLSCCLHLTNLAPLAALVKLQSLDISHCIRVTDLTHLEAMVNLQSLDMSHCSSVADLAPLKAMTSLKSLCTENTGSEGEDDGTCCVRSPPLHGISIAVCGLLHVARTFRGGSEGYEVVVTEARWRTRSVPAALQSWCKGAGCTILP
jgi:hypothetical protein